VRALPGLRAAVLSRAAMEAKLHAEKDACAEKDTPLAPQSLADIAAGRFVEGGSGVAASAPPPWLGPTQRSSYERTKDVFEERAFSFTLFFHVSLVIGFNLKPLLDALVFTDDSGTPAEALKRCASVVVLVVRALPSHLFADGRRLTPRRPHHPTRRYMDTFAHLIDWHTGNIFDPKQTAYTSVEAVRKIHAGVRSAMEAKGKNLAINQFNLAVVQTGFMGLVTVAPLQLGLVLRDSQLSDYVFFWRCVGRQLGIDDRYNLCGGGMRVSSTIVHEVPAPVNVSV